MALIRVKKQKRLKLLLLLFILVTIGIIIAIFFYYRPTSPLQESPEIASEEGTHMAIGRVHQTATRDGFKEWNLDAASVKYMEAEKKALFKDISVTFFIRDGTRVYLTAEKGILQTESKDIEVTGNVVVKNEKYRMETETLQYQHEKRLLFTKVPVKIIGKDFDLSSDSLSVDLNQQRAWFKGQVKGTINESAKF